MSSGVAEALVGLRKMDLGLTTEPQQTRRAENVGNKAERFHLRPHVVQKSPNQSAVSLKGKSLYLKACAVE